MRFFVSMVLSLFLVTGVPSATFADEESKTAEELEAQAAELREEALALMEKAVKLGVKAERMRIQNEGDSSGSTTRGWDSDCWVDCAFAPDVERCRDTCYY